MAQTKQREREISRNDGSIPAQSRIHISSYIYLFYAPRAPPLLVIPTLVQIMLRPSMGGCRCCCRLNKNHRNREKYKAATAQRRAFTFGWIHSGQKKGGNKKSLLCRCWTTTTTTTYVKRGSDQEDRRSRQATLLILLLLLLLCLMILNENLAAETSTAAKHHFSSCRFCFSFLFFFTLWTLWAPIAPAAGCRALLMPLNGWMDGWMLCSFTALNDMYTADRISTSRGLTCRKHFTSHPVVWVGSRELLGGFFPKNNDALFPTVDVPFSCTLPICSFGLPTLRFHVLSAVVFEERRRRRW